MPFSKMYDLVDALHRYTGRLLVFGNRLLASVVILGTLFSLSVAGVTPCLQEPERFLQAQAFMFNYHEFQRSEQQVQTHWLAASASTGLASSASVSSFSKDPNWDGLVAGAGLGVVAGQEIPLVGFIVGPVLGAVLGYRLDERI